MNTPQEPKPREFFVLKSCLSDICPTAFTSPPRDYEYIKLIEHSAYQKSQDELKLAKELLKKASEILEDVPCDCITVKHSSNCFTAIAKETLAELRAFQEKVK